MTAELRVLPALRRGVVSASSPFTWSKPPLELLASVNVLELLTGAAPALIELVLSLLTALRALDRHEARRAEHTGVGIDADDSDSDRRDVCSIGQSASHAQSTSWEMELRGMTLDDNSRQ